MGNPINKDTFLEFLPALGFTQGDGLWTKIIGATWLSVDVANEQLIYPEANGLTVNERQTCNFSAPENFVVFECVHRLLEKGYHPQDIELEPKWKLGHGASGGRADILVKDKKAKPLLLIECKTAGREFERAWKDTLQDGGQLFSYAQQISETQFLCLYASFIEDGALCYVSHVVVHRDNADYLRDNEKLKGFRDAADVRARFNVWRETYKFAYTESGLFEPSIQAYHIGKNKYTKNDLRPISDSDRQKKYHVFATILRQHNVSGRENAFDKLVNLFLCKLVDETENPDDLKFYWKGVAYDTHFDLFDRLQLLYKAGMGKFLGEEITYINEKEVTNALRFVRRDPDATQRAVWDLFRRQKFFTNNDFSFIDVHNEKLFYQNATVLLEILQMWQEIKLIGDHQHNQFLGDMFEGFLDQGVKQSEGQFFTPTPICRFLLSSLPLETLVQNSAAPPKAVDYACGAGHFLTELALQIKPLAEKHHPQKDIEDYHAAICGIEKEYRLSKIAKVSAFMYGQPRIKICYGDGLIPSHAMHPEIEDDSFDLLVANPPFSVKGFLETLPEIERAKYALTETINNLDTANSIETFFLERAKQLLKAGGIAAVIFPASLLSNGGGTYIRAREILLQFFDLVAIAELPPGTFGKTNTNTVTLFLRRKATNPDTAQHYKERVAAWFAHDAGQTDYQDEHLIDQYAAHIGLAPADYKTLLTGAPAVALLSHDTFAKYRRTFDNSTDVKNLKKQRSFQAKPAAQQEAELNKKFLAFAQAIERDNLLHFVLATQQPNRVLIVTSPTETKDRRKFLGYEWSGAKGDEGIKPIKDAQGRHLTPLYDETNRDNAEKINAAIASNFKGDLNAIPTALEEYLSLLPLPDLLDFSRDDFEKQIALAAKKSVAVQSKWPLKSVSDIVDIISGGTPDTNNALYWDGDIPWLSVADFSKKVRFVSEAEKSITQVGLDSSSTKLLQPGDIIISARGTVGAMAQLTTPMAFNQSCYGLRAKNSVSNDYLFYVLKREIQQLKSQATGSKFDAITMKTFEEVKLPIADATTQQQIVAECEAIDADAAAAQDSIEKARMQIVEKINASLQSFAAGKSVEIEKVCAVKGGKRVPKGYSLLNTPTDYPYIRVTDFKNKSVGLSGLQYITPEIFAQIKNYVISAEDVYISIAGTIGLVGTVPAELDGKSLTENAAKLVILDKNALHKKFLVECLASEFGQQQIKDKTHQMGVPKLALNRIEAIKIPLPPLAEQEKLVAAIEVWESEIAEAEIRLALVGAQKAAVLQKYL